ncbi:MAG TPA: FtsX-like permease family protein [Candidatus Sulfopaludibacter sp.]|nr:FtsX-like permease family protein [Candidatus Sulfopaludibacter sp.]
MLRSLLKNWQLNSIAVFSLAVAMALTVVALSVSNAILLRPPVSREPERLVTIYTADRAHGGAPGNFSYPDYAYLRDRNGSFSSMAALMYSYSKSSVTFAGRPDMAILNTVSDNYFEAMGIRPYLGHFFAAGDDARHVMGAVLTYAGWKRWGGDPKILGKTMKLSQRVLTIVGVAPPAFIAPVFGMGADLIVNIAADRGPGDRFMEDRQVRQLLLIGRLKPGATRPQARAEVQALWGQLAAAYPEAERNLAPAFMNASVLSPDEVDSARILSGVMIGATLLILLIACANAANLLLALATLRRQEALIKTALGAPRWRLIGEFLRETAAICGAGGVFGYAIASAALRWLSRFDLTMPPFGSFPVSADLHPGMTVAAGTLCLVLAASVVSGLAPALYASKPNLASALSGEIVIGGTRRSWIRNTVVGVQVAVCTLALAGTGICLESLHNLRSVDPGFSARKIAAAFVFLDNGGTTPEQGARMFDDLRRGVAAMPGVEGVALASDMPLGGDGPDIEEVRFPDRPASAQKITIGHSVVDASYFATMGIRLLDGRAFRQATGKADAEEIVINHFMAEKFWPRQNVIGRRIEVGEKHKPVTIVGIAADGKYGNLDEAPQPMMYYDMRRNYEGGGMLIARVSGDPHLWFEPITRLGRQLGIGVPFAPMTLDNWMNLTLFVPLVTLGCVSGLSMLALLLATVGLYGAISYSVRERRREFGIRIALGARPEQVMRLVFRRTLAIAGTGVLVGLGLGVAAGAVFRSQFFRIQTAPVSVLAPVGAGMAALSLAIAYAAARRWARMNPLDAVRHM